MSTILNEKKIYITGHKGLLGSAILKKLIEQGCKNILVKTREELDLCSQQEVYSFLQSEKPDIVVHAAAKVGGIGANINFPATFISENLIMTHNVIWGSYLAEVNELLFVGTSCSYPRENRQPIKEEDLLSGYFEPTNKPYALAKVSGMCLCDSISQQFGRNYFSVIFPNLYGPGDNFNLETSHVVGALINKFLHALPTKKVVLWGSGNVKRELMHSADAANACLFLLENNLKGHINAGPGKSYTIKEIAAMVQQISGHKGNISWDITKPEGFPEKTLDITKIKALGWRAEIELYEGLSQVYQWYSNILERQCIFNV